MLNARSMLDREANRLCSDNAHARFLSVVLAPEKQAHKQDPQWPSLQRRQYPGLDNDINSKNGSQDRSYAHLASSIIVLQGSCHKKV